MSDAAPANPERKPAPPILRAHLTGDLSHVFGPSVVLKPDAPRCCACGCPCTEDFVMVLDSPSKRLRLFFCPVDWVAADEQMRRWATAKLAEVNAAAHQRHLEHVRQQRIDHAAANRPALPSPPEGR